MKSQWHLIIATSVSMIATLVFQCRFAGTYADGSVYQRDFADNIHELALFARACLVHSTDSEQCYFDFPDIICRRTDLFVFLCILTRLSCGSQTLKYAFPVWCTFAVTWLIARYCDGNVLFYPVDTITVHLLVWQFVVLTCAWQIHELPWFSIRLHQSSSCVLLAFAAYYFHELLFRYLPVRFCLCIVWLLAIYDIFGTLHQDGPIRVNLKSTLENYSFEYAREPPGIYITHELDHDDDDDNFRSIGMGDFLIYNWMLLFILPPFISTEEKILVLIGHIISVQMGFWTTGFLRRCCGSTLMPGLPCPVVFVSFYVLLVDYVYCVL